MGMFLDQRRYAILKALIESYLKDAHPVGSKKLIDDYDFLVSAATMRNEMAFLEQLGLIEAPHTSAGRIPTDQGMRLFVDQLMDEIPRDRLASLQARRDLERIHTHAYEALIKEAVTSLSKVCGLVSFATMPWKGEYTCFGLSNLLKCGDFHNMATTSTVMETIEDHDGFVSLLNRFTIEGDVQIIIGEENAVPAFQSCSLIVGRYYLANGQSGLIGLLGPKRMQYAYNVAAVKAVCDDLSYYK